MHANPFGNNHLLLVTTGQCTGLKVQTAGLYAQFRCHFIGKIIKNIKIDDTAFGKAVNTRQSNVAQNGEVQNQALCFAVFGYEAQSCLNSILRLSNLQRLALENKLAACMRVNAKNSAHDFGTAAAHKAGKAQNLALA